MECTLESEQFSKISFPWFMIWHFFFIFMLLKEEREEEAAKREEELVQQKRMEKLSKLEVGADGEDAVEPELGKV